jgi:hypothetical protein
VSTSYAPPVQRLVSELSKLPGIGNRTAQRLAFHILRASAEDAAALAEAIREVKEKIGLCEVCFNLTDEARCRICQDTRRDHGLICVVEEPSDVIPMERTHEYHGVYHVLGGALSPIDGIDPEDLKIAELFDRVASFPRGHDPDGGPLDPLGVRHRGATELHHHQRLAHSALLPANALPSVTSSAYSRSEPTGRPLASLVTLTWGARERSSSAM